MYIRQLVNIRLHILLKSSYCLFIQNFLNIFAYQQKYPSAPNCNSAFRSDAIWDIDLFNYINSAYLYLYLYYTYTKIHLNKPKSRIYLYTIETGQK